MSDSNFLFVDCAYFGKANAVRYCARDDIAQHCHNTLSVFTLSVFTLSAGEKHNKETIFTIRSIEGTINKPLQD